MSETKRNGMMAMICLLLSLFILYETTKMPPNAAQYPQYLAFLLGLLSLILLIVTLRKRAKRRSEPSPVNKEKWMMIIQLMVILCVAVLLMQWVGFIISMILLMLGTIFILGYKRPFLGITVSCLTAVFVYFIFTSIFSVPLAGIF